MEMMKIMLARLPDDISPSLQADANYLIPSQTPLSTSQYFVMKHCSEIIHSPLFDTS